MLISAVTPLFLKTSNRANGVDKAVFESIRGGLRADRAQFLSDFNTLFYGTNRKKDAVSAAITTQTLNMGLLASIKATIDCVTAFSETDFRPDMKAFEIPTLVIHGTDDQVVPFEATGKLAAEMIRGASLRPHAARPHALPSTHKVRVNEDLLAFLKGS
ncbi:Non-heme chloroperoxidase [Labilithrix luteola]|uniref:Non-heme chloroperoxidase n=1 Tax=Labilithrix luteola TaxID=1391654 RepID=A0A0K1PWQ4_9BACT|nr:alpha/beta hydrolase [Labilithrix luteola]AKU97965.1 Non-heme chloroperoxidase [Labilithrix luteola]